MVNSLKTQLEEAKESEETMKIQLTKKEELCHAEIISHQPQKDSARKQGRNQKIED